MVLENVKIFRGEITKTNIFQIFLSFFEKLKDEKTKYPVFFFKIENLT
jgi:hypothetical protein